MFVLPLLLLPLLAALVQSQDPECTNAEVRTENPLGSCVCPGHLWISPGCEEGYWCEDTLGNGCYKTCPDGEVIKTSFHDKSWTCVPDDTPMKCPIGTYNVCPSDEEVTPPSDLDGNPLGTCRCDGEIWLAEGCRFGFKCDESMENGGEYKECPSGQTLFVDFETMLWSCTTNTDTCPGGSVLGHGCPMPDCTYAANPFGNCDCDGQYFINDDCTMGFSCQSNIPDPYLFDGCIQTCLDSEHLIANFEEDTWSCVSKTLAPTCFGQFNVECPSDEPLVDFDDFDSSICECDGQVYMSANCKQGFFCLENYAGGAGGVPKECTGEGEIITLPHEFDSQGWDCEVSDQCPGLGGFKLGCEGGNIEIPPLECDFEVNPFGECDGCEGQIYVNGDCTESFYCSDYIPVGQEPEVNGCFLHCDADKRVHVDIHTKEWSCVTREDTFTCPGSFKVDCPGDNYIVECACVNELWMNNDCTEAFLCHGPMVDGVNDMTVGKCPDGKIVDIDYNKPGSFGCIDVETATCPGSFHFGCYEGDINHDTTPVPTAMPGGGSRIGVLWGVVVGSVLMSVFNK